MVDSSTCLFKLDFFFVSRPSFQAFLLTDDTTLSYPSGEWTPRSAEKGSHGHFFGGFWRWQMGSRRAMDVFVVLCGFNVDKYQPKQ